MYIGAQKWERDRVPLPGPLPLVQTIACTPIRMRAAGVAKLILYRAAISRSKEQSEKGRKSTLTLFEGYTRGFLGKCIAHIRLSVFKTRAHVWGSHRRRCHTKCKMRILFSARLARRDVEEWRFFSMSQGRLSTHDAWEIVHNYTDATTWPSCSIFLVFLSKQVLRESRSQRVHCRHAR